VIYSKHVSTPKLPEGLKYKRTPLLITRGLVYKAELYFPRGSAGLMGVAIFDGCYSIWPSNIGEFFTGDEEVISFDDLYLKDAAPFQFDIWTYNLDEGHDHIVDVRVGLVSKEAYQARFLPAVAWGQFAKMMSRLLAEQVEKAAVQKEVIAEKAFQWLEG